MLREIYLEWEKCRDALLPSLDLVKGTHNEDDVIAGLFTGQFKLWRNGESGLVTDITVFPRLKALNVFLFGGKLAELVALRPQLEQYRQEQGCKRITGISVRGDSDRSGLERILGGDVLGICMYKDY